MPREPAVRITPEQEQQLKTTLGQRALGGLAAVGNLLDLPVSMVRDALAFRNPLDQLLSPFSDTGRTTGRDLLRQYGLVGKEDTWSNFIPGMAAEIALDPTTYIGFGALGKAAKAAKSTGMLDDAVKVARKKAVQQERESLLQSVAKQQPPPSPPTPPMGGLGGGPPTPPPAPLAPSPVASTPTPTPGHASPPKKLTLGQRLLAGISDLDAKGTDPNSGWYSALLSTGGRDITKAKLKGRTLRQYVIDFANEAEQFDADRALKQLGITPEPTTGPLASFIKPRDAAKQQSLGLAVDAVEQAGQATPVPPKSPPASPPPPPTPPVSSAATPPPSPPYPKRYIGPREARMTTTLADVVEHRLGDNLGGAVPKTGNQLNLDEIRQLNVAKANSTLDNLENYAKASGYQSTQDMLDKIGGDKLGGLAGYGLPGTGEMNPLFTGEKSLKVAKVLDTIGQYTNDSLLGRTVKALFHAPSGGSLNIHGQRFNESLHEATKDANASARKANYEFRMAVDKLAKEHNLPHRDIEELVNAAGDVASFNAAKGREYLGGKFLDPKYEPLDAKVSVLAAKEASRFDNIRQQVSDLGFKIGDIEEDDMTRYFPRHASGDKKDLELFARSNVLQRLPQSVVTDIVGNLQRKPAQIRDKYRTLLDHINKGDAEQVQKHAEDLATIADHFPTAAVDRQQGLKSLGQEGYLYDPPTDAQGLYLDRMHRKFAISKALNDTFAQSAIPRAEYEKLVALDPSAKDKYMPIFQQLHDGPDTEAFSSAFMVNGAKDKGMLGLEDGKKAAAAFAKQHGYKMEELKDLFIPIEMRDEVLKTAGRRVAGSETDQVIRDMLHKGTQFMKDNLTLPFPGFHGRNLFSGLLGMNILESGVVHSLKDLSDLKGFYDKAKQIRDNPASDPKMMEELFAMGAVDYSKATGDVGIKQATEHGSLVPGSPLDVKSSWQKGQQQAAVDAAARQAAADRRTAAYEAKQLGQQPSFLDDAQYQAQSGIDKLMGAVDKVAPAYHAAMNTGAKTAANIEFVNRSALYMYLRSRGWSPLEAVQKVNDVHVQYNDITPFERNLKLAVPFYSFSRKVGEETFKELARNPGGPMGMTIKAANRARGNDASTPDYVAETTSIPLGVSEDGTRRYITGFGMPWEDPLSFFGKGVRGAGLESLSRLNPVLKAPLEYSTGQTFFQSTPEGGRPLGDADPLLGRLAANVTGNPNAYNFGQLTEVAAANSPLTRYLSTARQLTDTRKGMLDKLINLATGMRITDVSPAAQDAILREQTQNALRDYGGRSFIRTYVPETALEQMSDTERQQALELQGLLNTLADRAKERKLAKAAAK